jgi:ferric-dicitrate binding protein FerR (iron transport regulator)
MWLDDQSLIALNEFLFMSEQTDDKNIDWEKLAELYDGEEIPAGLTEEEFRALASMREIKARVALQGTSVEEGWQQFDRARRRARVVRMTRLLAAAVLILAVGAGVWMMWPGRQVSPSHHELANAAPSDKVQLKLGDGRTITPGNEWQTIQHGSEATIKADNNSITYAGSASAKTSIAMDTLLVPKGLQFRLQLADSTMVWLNAATRLCYPAVFSGATREVYVEGEAFFHVKANPAQPFIVHAGNNSLKVLGTSFNVNTFDEMITTTLATGRLQVTAGEAQTILTPGEQTICREGQLDQQAVDLRLFTAWKDGDLFFEDATLLDITRYLARNYDYHFEFNDASLKSQRFTLDIPRPAQLQGALDLIRRSVHGISFQVHDRTVEVNKLSDGK